MAGERKIRSFAQHHFLDPRSPPNGPGSSTSLLSSAPLELCEALDERQMVASVSTPKFLMKTSVFIHQANISVEMYGRRAVTEESQFLFLPLKLLKEGRWGEGRKKALHTQGVIPTIHALSWACAS